MLSSLVQKVENLVRLHEKMYPKTKIRVAIALNRKLFFWGDTETLFEISSLSKMFMASAVLRLQERGMLALTQEIGTYLTKEEIRLLKRKGVAYHRVHLEQLLNHYSGLGDFMNLRGGVRTLIDHRSLYAKELELERKIELSLENTSMPFRPPGIEQQYSNLGYNLLGHIVENVEGRDYQEIIARECWQIPVLEKSSFMTMTSEYESGQYHQTRIKSPPSLMKYAACALSTTKELLRWLEFFRQKKLLSESLLDFIAESCRRSSFGYGFHHYDQFIGHSGTGFGNRTGGFFHPKRPISYVVSVDSVTDHDFERFQENLTSLLTKKNI